MTATATRPAAILPPAGRPVPPRPPGGGGKPRSTERPWAWLTTSAELTLTALTLAAVAGFVRLFTGLDFLVPVLVAAAAAHGLAIACRRAGLGLLGAAAVSAGGLVLAVAWLVLPDTTTYGLPGLDTWNRAGEELRGAWETFRTVIAPAPAEPGFLIATIVAVWFGALMADTAAFRFRTAVESAVPAATLFVFAAALGAPTHREPVTAAFLGLLLLHALHQRALRQASAPTWMAGGSGAGTAALFRTGGALAVVALLAAMVLGPRLPGADDPAVIPWRAFDRAAPTARVTISPLVDIRSRLVNQAEVEVFQVRASERTYWRVTALELFDGRIWSSRGSYRPATGPLPGAPQNPDLFRPVIQDYSITALSSLWLPAAYRPNAVIGVEGVRYDPESGSLLTEEETSDGLVYRVISSVPRLDAGILAAVEPVAPARVAETYTELPVGFSVRVSALAAEVTAEAPTQYEKALALQDFLRNNFEYDIDVTPGHSEDHLERFLFDTRRGYCEQFAGAYAAMARSIGLPARVAVGFTPGELDDDGVHRVRGANAHAWPEVYLDGVGWVAFEPTPGRGMPGAESYTGVPEQQASPDDPTSATTVPAGETPGPDAGGSPDTTTPDPLAGMDDFDVATGDPADRGGEGDDGAGAWVGRGLLALLGLGVLWPTGIAVATAVRRRRRRSAASTPKARIRLAWAEGCEALARLGTRRHLSETHVEFALRTGRRGGIEPQRFARLAALVTAADYAPVEIAEDAAAEAAAIAREVERAASGRATLGERARWMFDPRPLLPARPQHVLIIDARTGADATGGARSGGVVLAATRRA